MSKTICPRCCGQMVITTLIGDEYEEIPCPPCKGSGRVEDTRIVNELSSIMNETPDKAKQRYEDEQERKRMQGCPPGMA